MNERVFMWLLALGCAGCCGVSVSCGKRRDSIADSSQSAIDARNDSPATSTAQESKRFVSANSLGVRPREIATEDYVGSESCRRCHAEYHQSWHASYHRTMTQLVSAKTAPEAIKAGTVRVDGLSYKFQERQGKFFVDFNDPLAGGKTKSRELVMMTGSHHMHAFWFASGVPGTPGLLPIIYLRDQQRWIPRESAFLSPSDTPRSAELGRWNTTCSRCHSTHPRARPRRTSDVSQVWDTQVIEFGIACEACHGPGGGHVKFHDRIVTDGVEGKTNESTDPIQNPRDLGQSASSEICAQCHAILAVDYAHFAKSQFEENGSPFRPGQTFDDSKFLAVVRARPEDRDSATWQHWNSHPQMMESHFWPDGEVRISGRDYNGMVDSKCFQAGELTCISCHTMHQNDRDLQSDWKSDQLSPSMRGNDACLQCHPKYEELGAAHTHHPIGSAGSQCMNCHMPHTVYGLLKTIRSHKITSPSVQATLETGRANACNLCHLDHTLQETSDHLAKWYGHDRPTLSNDQQKIAASIVHLLKGDAAQRVLQVSAFESEASREVSGSAWMKPYLMVAMDDPYDAIRLIAHRAYRSIFADQPLEYDFLDMHYKREEILRSASERYAEEMRLESDNALLIGAGGSVDQAEIQRLLEERDERPVRLLE